MIWNLFFVFIICCYVRIGESYEAEYAGLTSVPLDIPTNTTILKLKDNSISEFPDVILLTLTHLQTVELISNDLTQLPPFDLVGSTLKVIFVGRNQITCVSRSILDKLPQLVELGLNFNPLLAFPETSLLFQPSFKKLYVENTLVSAIPSIEARNPSFQRVYIYHGHSPVYCDCKMAWAFRESFGRWTFYLNDYPCVGPPEKTALHRSNVTITCSDDAESVFYKQFKGFVAVNNLHRRGLGEIEFQCMGKCLENTQICSGFRLREAFDSSDIICELIDPGLCSNMTVSQGEALYTVKQIAP